MRKFVAVLGLGALLSATACADGSDPTSLTPGAGQSFAYANTAFYVGQGLLADGFGGYDLITEKCDGNIDGILENGADAEGPYLLFVLTATGAKNAEITFPSGTNVGTFPMTKYGNGTFKYIAQWDDPDALIAAGVYATYDGKAKNAQLVISHGCRPFVEGAWCSPGFWRNARDGAWTLINTSRSTLWNSSVFGFGDYTNYADVANYFSTATGLLAGPVLYSSSIPLGVLNDASTYSGPSIGDFSFNGSTPDALNAFNATGAYLTSLIPGYNYDPLVKAAGGSDACPIDSFGDYKDGREP